MQYSSKDMLKIHLKVYHQGIKPYQCAICQKTLTRQTSLRLHVYHCHYKVLKGINVKQENLNEQTATETI